MVQRLFVFAVALFLSGCLYQTSNSGAFRVDHPQKLPHTVSDSSYEKVELTWKGTYEGHKSQVYMKRFNQKGILTLCGFRVRTGTLQYNLDEEWFNEAEIYIDNAKIVDADFLLHQPAKYAAVEEVAACIWTGWTVTDAMMKEPIYFSGDAVEYHSD